ncbi:MAG: HAD-IA family hydrolase [Spirochaetes bacterium]|nr:HAD-IA family hydrolase [Spirochaetota bacterium]MBU1079944.1 HAD-IA family hydrolase [Spirochaetota bacterium]
MIDLYIFDEGGVLIRNHMILNDVAAAMGMEPGALRGLLPPDMGPFSRGDIDEAEFWRRFEARTGIKPAEKYWATRFKPTRDEPTFALVRELARGARVVCGTNTVDSHHVINEELGMYECFHAVYASHIIHRVKPEPGFWLDILEAEGVSPERAFFTDDSQENVDAAEALGIRSRLYTDAETLRRDLVALGAPVRATGGPSPA